MKVTVNKKALQKTFPKLMISSDGDIVYFPGKGMLLSDTRKQLYWGSWVMDYFVDFNGSITLQNED